MKIINSRLYLDDYDTLPDGFPTEYDPDRCERIVATMSPNYTGDQQKLKKDYKQYVEDFFSHRVYLRYLSQLGLTYKTFIGNEGTEIKVLNASFPDVEAGKLYSISYLSEHSYDRAFATGIYEAVGRYQDNIRKPSNERDTQLIEVVQLLRPIIGLIAAPVPLQILDYYYAFYLSMLLKLHASDLLYRTSNQFLLKSRRSYYAIPRFTLPMISGPVKVPELPDSIDSLPLAEMSQGHKYWVSLRMNQLLDDYPEESPLERDLIIGKASGLYHAGVGHQYGYGCQLAPYSGISPNGSLISLTRKQALYED